MTRTPFGMIAGDLDDYMRYHFRDTTRPPGPADLLQNRPYLLPHHNLLAYLPPLNRRRRVNRRFTIQPPIRRAARVRVSWGHWIVATLGPTDGWTLDWIVSFVLWLITFLLHISSANKGTSPRLHSEMIRPPGADPLLDLALRRDLLVQHRPGQVGELRVAREAEGDELAGPKLAGAGPEVRRQQPLHPLGLFEADQPVLDLQGEGAGIEGDQHEGERHGHGENAVEQRDARQAPTQPVHGPDQVDGQDAIE